MTFIKFHSKNKPKYVCYYLNKYDKLVDSNNQETSCKNEKKLKINHSKKILTWGDNCTMSFEDFYFKNKNNIHKKLDNKGLNSNDFFKNYTNVSSNNHLLDKSNTSNKNKKQKNNQNWIIYLLNCCTPYNDY